MLTNMAFDGSSSEKNKGIVTRRPVSLGPKMIAKSKRDDIPSSEKGDWSGKKEEVPSCDKGGHRERSESNDQGQHRDHWKRAEREQGRSRNRDR